MAEGKKSFTAYCDWKETFDSLPDEKAGQLIKHLFSYVNDENPQTDDILIKAVFAQMKATLKRDLKKWEAKREQNKENALKRWNKNNATVCDRIETDAKNAVSDSVSVSVSDSVRDINNDDGKKEKSDDVSFPIEKCKEMYLANEKILKAVSDNPQNKITIEEIPNRIVEFNKHLLENGEVTKTYKDYCSHFKNWHKANKKATTPQKRRFL